LGINFNILDLLDNSLAISTVDNRTEVGFERSAVDGARLTGVPYNIGTSVEARRKAVCGIGVLTVDRHNISSDFATPLSCD